MFSPSNLIAGFLFGVIGWSSVSYGRKLGFWKPIAIGMALMLYPYFFTNVWLLWGVGIALVVTLWLHHDE